MRQIWGGLLVMAAGLVLALTGAFGGADAAAGIQTCGIQVGVNGNCPVGTIRVTAATTPGDAAPPSAFTLTIDSDNCPVADDTFDVPPAGVTDSPDLFVYRDTGQGVACSYTLTETPVDGYTASFDPAGPYTLPDSVDASVLPVTLVNNGVITSPSSTPTQTPPVTDSGTPSPVQTTTDVTNYPAESASATATGTELAATGTSTSVGWTVWLGAALCLGGAALVATGWRRRGTHRA